MSTGSTITAAPPPPAFVELPDDLDDMPPGPRLGFVLARLDPTRHTGPQLAILVAARLRQIAFEQAQLLRAIRELAHAPATAEGRAAPIRDKNQNPFTAVEMSFATTWTEYTSATMIGLSDFAYDQVPAVGRALTKGTLDLDKAKVLYREVEDIDDRDQRRAVVEAALPESGNETTAQLRARLRRLVAKVDPDAVRQRRRKAVESRTVDHIEFSNGTAMLSAVYLPTEKAAAAFDHVDALARATLKAGDSQERSLDQLRADVFADLLGGVDPARAGYAVPSDRRGIIHLHIDLPTLACLAEETGEIVGYGPVIADVARQTATQIGQKSQWRFTVTDDGEVWAEGTIDRKAAKGLSDELTRWAADATAGEDGRYRYRPTTAQIAFVQARDKTCRAPGCRRTAMRCEIDHNLDWVKGGPTLIDSLCCLCKRHHRAKHVGNYKVRRGPNGIEWETPFALKYQVIPEHRWIPSGLVADVDQFLHGSSKYRR